ncbi:hypothetical protein ACCT30_28685, partial [Rhizobium ruizarguesonis]
MPFPHRVLSRFTDVGRINFPFKNSGLLARQQGKIVKILPFDKFLNLSYASLTGRLPIMRELQWNDWKPGSMPAGFRPPSMMLIFPI